MIIGLFSPTDGEIYYDGISINELDLAIFAVKLVQCRKT